MMHPLGGQVLSVRAIASNVFGGTGEHKLVGVYFDGALLCRELQVFPKFERFT